MRRELDTQRASEAQEAARRRLDERRRMEMQPLRRGLGDDERAEEEGGRRELAAALP